MADDHSGHSDMMDKDMDHNMENDMEKQMEDGHMDDEENFNANHEEKTGHDMMEHDMENDMAKDMDNDHKDHDSHAGHESKTEDTGSHDNHIDGHGDGHGMWMFFHTEPEITFLI